MRGARVLVAAVAATLIGAACSSSGSKGAKAPAAHATTSTTIVDVITSDPLSLAENAAFANTIHKVLPQFCGTHTLFRRNVTTPPSYHYPIIGGEAECTAWHQYTQNFAFKNTTDVAKYVRRRTAVECGLANAKGRPQALFGLHWVLRPHSATLVTSNDFMHELAAVLGGQPHTQFCTSTVNFAGAWNEMSAIDTLMKQGGFTCGTLVVDATNPLYRGSLLLDSTGKPLAMHAVCAANPTVQVIGVNPTVGDSVDTHTLVGIQRYLCTQSPNAQAIRGITGMTIVPDPAMAQQIGKALTTPVTPICS